MSTTRRVEFRGRFGTALTGAVAVLAAAALALTAVEDVGAAVRVAPTLAAVVLGVWLLYARPAVIVDDGGVELRNVTRTVHLPWPSIRRVDTKYALTFETAYGTFSAWAAPAPGQRTVRHASQGDLRHLPESTYVGGAVRPGDLASTASGGAAAHIRRRLDDLRDAGHLDDPRLEADAPRVHWHVAPALVLAALIAVALVAPRL